MLREKISRSVSEEISSSGKQVVHLASLKVAESAEADASKSMNKSEEKFFKEISRSIRGCPKHIQTAVG